MHPSSARLTLALALTLAASAIAQTQPESASPVIETARKAALAFTDSLPDFIVNRTTTRYRGAPTMITRNQAPVQPFQILNPISDWQSLDTISGNIATEHGRETYSNIVVNGKPAAALPSAGIWSQGEFSSALLAVLSPDSAAQFAARGRDRIRNHRASRYDFAVDQAHSKWSLPGETGNRVSSDVRFTPAFDGTIWIDDGTGQVLRILIAARGLPENYPAHSIETTIDYDLVKIADASYVLPVQSEIVTCENNDVLCFRNVSVFRDYKKFAADTSLTFEK